MGLEAAGAIAVFALIGYWLDGRYDTAPWGLIIGVVLGMVGGLYNLVRESLQAVKEARTDDEVRRGPDGDTPVGDGE